VWSAVEAEKVVKKMDIPKGSQIYISKALVAISDLKKVRTDDLGY
jgi:hypothetical protein